MGYLILLAAIITVIVIFAVYAQSKAEAAAVATAAAIPDFSAAKYYSSPFDKTGLALDPVRRKALTLPYGSILEGANISAVEVVRDDFSLQKTNRGSQLAGAAIGGVVLGPVGLILGGVTGSKRTEEKTKEVVLRIYTNDLMRPFQDITFYRNPNGATSDDSFLRSQVKEMEYWHGALKMLMQPEVAPPKNLFESEPISIAAPDTIIETEALPEPSPEDTAKKKAALRAELAAMKKV